MGYFEVEYNEDVAAEVRAAAVAAGIDAGAIIDEVSSIFLGFPSDLCHCSVLKALWGCKMKQWPVSKCQSCDMKCPALSSY